ncbi:14067_t:CDS:2 [Acaulospora morrowiae]|uniref:14067_t:CDS:1 n=1 Tax=Acaulospora morrowiae TaxID=94023 RepID=A0A9N8W0B2_9GLOM|nr:14067_t:CDS:2 [Acaulospora morrowiae]
MASSLSPEQLQELHELEQIGEDKVRQITFLEIMLKRIDPNISNTHMKNCVSYVLEIIFTTAGLIILIMIHRLYGKDWTYRDYKLLQLATLIIMDLYIFELIYRPIMRIPLIIHHFATIGITLLGYYVLNQTEKLDVSAEGIALLFQATTEQATFVGLLFYRIKPNWAKIILRFSTFQVLFSKLGTLAWCYFMWKRDMIGNYKNTSFDKAWNIIFPIVGLILVWTQIWSTYVVWVISSKKRPAKNIEIKEDCEKGTSNTEGRRDSGNENPATERRRIEVNTNGPTTEDNRNNNNGGIAPIER